MKEKTKFFKSIKEKIIKAKEERHSDDAFILLSGTDYYRKQKHNEEVKKGYTSIKYFTPVNPSDKVEEFLKWNFDTMIKGKYSSVYEFRQKDDLRNLIEKIAVWYELRYPDYEINKLMHCEGSEEKDINSIMFKNNQYVTELLGEDNDAKILDFYDFYNKIVFIKSLPYEERLYFGKPWYSSIVYLKQPLFPHLHLNKAGYVELAEGFTNYTKTVIKDNELSGMHLKEVINLFKERNVELPEDSELLQEQERVDNSNKQTEGMLDSVMYRLIERSHGRIGVRRALLFAKEFKRNVDIPMKYAVDTADPGLRLFVNEYIKAGGHKDLVCYVNYYRRSSKNEKVQTTTVANLIERRRNNSEEFYTKEEKELHARLIGSLYNKVDQTELEKERKNLAKKLRIERKLKKSLNKINRG